MNTPTKAMLALGEPTGMFDGGYPWRIVPARYAKGQMALHIANGTGFKRRAERLADHLKMRYSHRERALIASPAKMEKWMCYLAEGYDAGVFSEKLIAPELTP